eukprot:1632098-Prymnesium_polylepis.1
MQRPSVTHEPAVTVKNTGGAGGSGDTGGRDGGGSRGGDSILAMAETLVEVSVVGSQHEGTGGTTGGDGGGCSGGCEGYRWAGGLLSPPYATLAR